MGLIEAFWHLFEFVYPALALGVLSAAGAKVLWRAELAAKPWWRLAAAVALSGVAVLVAGLVVFGRDGRMLTYAGLVVVAAVVLWFSGFRRAARRPVARTRRDPQHKG